MTHIIETVYHQPATVANLRSGLLGKYIEGFAVALMSQGYARATLRVKIRAIGRWNKWLHKRPIDVAGLNEALITEFIRTLPRTLYRQSGVRTTLHRFINYLREIGVVHTPIPSTNSEPRSFIERDYELYLSQERGLTPPTIRYNLFHVHRFLNERFGPDNIELNKLCQDDITKHILQHSSEYQQRSAQTWTSALRGFIRYLNLRGLTKTDLTGCVLKSADWNLSALPKYIEAEEVERLLKSIDCNTAVGLRDYALLLIIARLGLRGGEVVQLELEDFNWLEGTLRVHGKNARWSYLPVTKEIGEAVVNYLRKGRPTCATRRVFLTAVAPYHELKSSANVTAIVARHLKSAGIKATRAGAHLLRHSLATQMLQGGGSLEEICQVLRHLHLSTTEIYAKVNFTALKEIVQPWPGNQQ